jgi:hypothetical protein
VPCQRQSDNKNSEGKVTHISYCRPIFSLYITPIFKPNFSVHLSVYQLVFCLLIYFDTKGDKVEFCRLPVATLRGHSCSYKNDHQMAALANKVVVVIQRVAMLPSDPVYNDTSANE